jgi:hypothetical protein
MRVRSRGCAHAAAVVARAASAHNPELTRARARTAAPAAPKGGSRAHRGRKNVAKFFRDKTHADVLKDHPFDMGGNAKTPYAPSTITQYVDSVKAFYQRYPETRGKGEGENPGFAKCVADMLSALRFVLGTARVNVVDEMQPWVVQRVLATLRSESVQECVMAIMFSHRMLGERPSTLFLRDHRHFTLSERGLEIYRAYLKTDKVRGGLRGTACARC